MDRQPVLLFYEKSSAIDAAFLLTLLHWDYRIQSGCYRILYLFEFIIYLLKTAMKDEGAFLSVGNWTLTEGLAEYYFQKTDSNSRSFQSCQEQAEVYRQLESTCGTDAVTLYRVALKQ